MRIESQIVGYLVFYDKGMLMFKIYGNIIFFAVTVSMQFFTVVIASDNPKSGKIILHEIDVPQSIHDTQVVSNFNKKKSEEEILHFSMSTFCGGDRREDRMIEEQKKKNRLSLILPKLCRNNRIDELEDSISGSHNSTATHTPKKIEHSTSRIALVQDVQIEQAQNLPTANVFDGSLESLLHRTQMIQACKHIDQTTHKKLVNRLIHFKPSERESCSSGSDVSLYNGEMLDDFLLSDFQEQIYKLHVSPSSESDRQSDEDLSV